MATTKFLEKLKIPSQVSQTLRRELSALAVATAVFGGASTGYIILQKLFNIFTLDWWLVATCVTILSLPKVFHRVKRTKGPAVVKAAHAFRGGFLAVQDFLPSFSKTAVRIRKFWQNISSPS